jgi:hypothetical protein
MSKSPLSFEGLQHTQQCQVGWSIPLSLFVPCIEINIDLNEWCVNNGLLKGGLNPEPHGPEFSALTTRPRLLALIMIG